MPPAYSPEDQALLRQIDMASQAGDQAGVLAAASAFLERHPGAGWMWNRKGVAAGQMGDRRLAEACYLNAVAAPEQSQAQYAHSNLAALYLAAHRLPEALDHARAAVRLAPDFATGWHNLGNILLRLNDARAALDAFNRAFACGHTSSIAQIYETKRRLCDWENLDAVEAAAMQLAIDHPAKITPMVFLGYMPATAAQQRDYAIRYAEARCGVGRARPAARRTAGRKIRLGYLSSDFTDHPVAHLLVNTIENHDRERFTVAGFSIGPSSDHPMARRIRQAFDQLHDLSHLNDAEAAEAIHGQDIDILIDLNGYTAGCRPHILAQRPAAVQINYLGMPGTMGAAFMDYVIADDIVAPDPADFTEQVLRLDCYLPTDSRRAVHETPSRTSLGLPDDAVILASMNAAWKLTPSVLDTWTDILRRAPEAVLWQAGGADGDSGLAEEIRRRGIEGQVIFAARAADQSRHLARIGQADLALDTFPYGGHATTIDMLWAGVPVLTLLGQSFCARVAASVLTAAGLPDLIAVSREDYRDKALALIGDKARLRALKHRLVEGRAANPLFDNIAYTRTLENALLSTLPA